MRKSALANFTAFLAAMTSIIFQKLFQPKFSLFHLKKPTLENATYPASLNLG